MRRFLRQLLFTFIAVSWTASAIAESDVKSELDKADCGIVYGDHHSFFICAPNGWILDNKSGVPQGIHAVFYPIGKTWNNSSVMMYTNWAAKDEEIRDIKSLVEFNIKKLKSSGSIDIKVEFKGSIDIKDGKTCHIWEYSGDKWGDYELVGYIDEQKGFVIMVFNARNKIDFNNTRQKFFELVKSYSFLSKKVEYPKE